MTPHSDKVHEAHDAYKDSFLQNWRATLLLEHVVFIAHPCAVSGRVKDGSQNNRAHQQRPDAQDDSEEWQIAIAHPCVFEEGANVLTAVPRNEENHLPRADTRGPFEVNTAKLEHVVKRARIPICTYNNIRLFRCVPRRRGKGGMKHLKKPRHNLHRPVAPAIK